MPVDQVNLSVPLPCCNQRYIFTWKAAAHLATVLRTCYKCRSTWALYVSSFDQAFEKPVLGTIDGFNYSLEREGSKLLKARKAFSVYQAPMAASAIKCGETFEALSLQICHKGYRSLTSAQKIVYDEFRAERNLPPGAVVLEEFAYYRRLAASEAVVAVEE